MKTLIKIIVCVTIVIVQVCLLKASYNKGKQDKQREAELLQLEVYKIG